MIEKKLTFEASDVTYIIVKEESQVRFIIKTINELKYLGGSKIRLNQYDKDLLCSKIIQGNESIKISSLWKNNLIIL